MKFCSHCGNPNLQFSIPEGDNRPRYWCPDCETIHYQNPKIVVGAVPMWQGKVLLCKRSIEPRKGYWTLPAGYMENGETLQEGAARETWEEACATVAIGDLYTVFNLPHINQVYVLFSVTWKTAKRAATPACFLWMKSPGMNWPSPPSAAPYGFILMTLRATIFPYARRISSRSNVARKTNNRSPAATLSAYPATALASTNRWQALHRGETGVTH